MTSMLAGSYIGPVGALSVHSPTPTVVARTGAGIRESIADTYLGRAGLRGRGGLSLGKLGDPNLCTDPGWQFAQALMGGAGAAITAGAGTDRGWAAAGAGTAGVAAGWAATCAAQAAAAGATTPGSGFATGDTQAAINAALAAQAAAGSQQQIMMQQQALAAQQAQTQQRNMLLIGGGVAAALLLGLGAVVVLRR